MNLQAANQRLYQMRERHNRRDSRMLGRGWLTTVQTALESPISAENNTSSDSAESPSTFPEINYINVNVTLLTAMTKAKAVLSGRCWLLLWQLVNRQRGQQHIDESEAQQLFIDADSPYKMFGQRQWRKVRGHGEGLFWDVLTDGRLFIYGRQRAADQLSLSHFGSKFTELDPERLTKKPSKVSAEFLNIFHAAHGDNPISRAAIETATGIDERTQRNYEKEEGITTRRNVTIIAPYEPTADKIASYKFGRNTFHLVDKKGKQGAVGQIYVARLLPNSYQSTANTTASRNRMKRLNRTLNRLNTGKTAIFRKFDQQHFDCPKAARRQKSRQPSDIPINFKTPIGMSCNVYQSMN